MSELPRGWASILIGETGEYINGFAFKPEHRSPTGRPIIRIQNLTDPSKPLNRTDIEVPDAYEVRSGDMLVSWSATLDVFVWRGETALVNQHIFKVAPSASVIEPRLLFYWLKHAIDELQETEHLHGSTMKHINRGPFLARELPLPPRREQPRIVNKLEELLSDLDAGVAELKDAQKKLTQYRRSLLKAAVEGRLTDAWRAQHPPSETGARLLERILTERRARWEARQLAKFKKQGKTPPKDWQKKYPEPVKPDTSGLPDLPEGWVWGGLDQLAEIQGGIQKQPSRAPVSNKHPFLRVANVARGELRLDEVHEIELFSGEAERLVLQTGDLLIVEGNGSRTEIGRCAIWDGSIPNTVHQNHLIRARPLLIESVLVETWLNSVYGTTKMAELAATTSGLYTLSVSKIARLPVPVPPLEEQRLVIESLGSLLDEARRQQQAIQVALDHCTAQRQNILRAAFSGQLVPQDPNDEPASVLLERIRAERAAQAAVKKPRRKVREPA
nr:restriction endonuclease subunit S [uncultured Caldimonas sp.]